MVNKTTPYVNIKIKSFPSPIASGKLSARAILKPPRSPPQVIISAVFFSKLFFRDKIFMGKILQYLAKQPLLLL